MAGELAERAMCGEKLDGVLIIDGHAHMGPWCPLQALACSANDMVAYMDAIGVDAVCASGFLSITADFRLGNDMVADAIRRHPGRFVGYATINPHYPTDVLPELERCFDELNMTALKFHPAWHSYPVDGHSYMQALEFANDRRALVLSHTWGTPALLESLATKYTDVSFLVAHHAHINSPDIDHTVWAGLIRDLPNVYADLASSVALMGGFELMVRTVGAHKVIFGSDTPLHDLAYQLGRVLLADLDDEDKKDILGRNLARLVPGFDR